MDILDKYNAQLDGFKKQHRKYCLCSALNESLKKNSGRSVREIFDGMLAELYTIVVPEHNRRLMAIAFNKNLTQQELNVYLQQCDIETMNSETALLLAYVMKEHEHLDFGNYNGPRLKGLFRYYRFQNLELAVHFSKIVQEMNAAGIVPMVIKGGAMKFLRPELPRIMGDMDVLVPTVEDYCRARTIIVNLGYIYKEAGHSLDVHTEKNFESGILDIHKHLSFCGNDDEEFNKRLFVGAAKYTELKVDFYVPRMEDMIYVCLCNLARNLCKNTSINGIPFAIFDLVYLINSEMKIDWTRVAENVSYNNQELDYYIAAKFVNSVLGDIIPFTFLDEKKLDECVQRRMKKDIPFTKFIYNSRFVMTLSMLKKMWREKGFLKG